MASRTRALVASALRARPQGTRLAAVPSPVARPHSNLPAELTSLVGRRDELGAIKRRRGTPRLLTLPGPGGVEKPRLPLRPARDLASHFADGARFVRLAEVSAPADVSSAVAATLGLQ